MEFEKVSNSQIKVIKPVEVKQEEVTYSYDFLLQQEEAIVKQLAEFTEAREKELVEVRSLISECEKLGIKKMELPVGEEPKEEEPVEDLLPPPPPKEEEEEPEEEVEKVEKTK